MSQTSQLCRSFAFGLKTVLRVDVAPRELLSTSASTLVSTLVGIQHRYPQNGIYAGGSMLGARKIGKNDDESRNTNFENVRTKTNSKTSGNH